MWRCYSHGNKSIRIRTTNEKLLIRAKKLFPEKECFDVYLRKVGYDLSDKSGIEQQIEEMKNSRSINETYFHKRPVFEHEGEYRLLIEDTIEFHIGGHSFSMTPVWDISLGDYAVITGNDTINLIGVFICK